MFHEGGVSFGGSKATGMARASAVIRDRYRYFAPANRRERSEDPLAVSFAALELALEEPSTGRPQVLHVMHVPSVPPGGTERHVESLTTALADQFDSSVLFPVESGFVLRRTMTSEDGVERSREYLLPGGATQVSPVDDRVAGAALRIALDLFDFDAVHLHNLIGHSLAPFEVCRDFPGRVICTFHDFYLACPNHSLLYQDRIDCGIPDDLSVCATCLPNSRTGGSVEILQQFRERAASGFEVIDRVVVADIVTADYVQRVHAIPQDRISVIEHGSIIGLPDRREVDESAILSEPLRLAFIGRAWAKKGLGIVNHAATTLSGAGIEIHHFGPPSEPLATEVIPHGTYLNADLPRLLHEAGIRIVFLPGPCAETYSYVMTEALVAGLPLIGAGHGALGHRIRSLGVGWTIDPTDPASVVELIRNLDRCRPEVIRATTRACEVPLTSADASADRYVDLYLDAPIRSETMPKSSSMADDQMRRHLRALAAVNRQLHAQIADQPPTTGQRLAARSREVLERAAPRVFRCAEIGFEASATARAVVVSARDAVRRRTTSR